MVKWTVEGTSEAATGTAGVSRPEVTKYSINSGTGMLLVPVWHAVALGSQAAEKQAPVTVPKGKKKMGKSHMTTVSLIRGIDRTAWPLR